MERLFEALIPMVRLIVRRPFIVLVIGLTISIGTGFAASQLYIDSDFANLIPEEYPSVQAITALQEEVGGENEATVIIESPSFIDNQRFAEALIPIVLALRDDAGNLMFREADYRREVEFLKNNALYLATPEELDSLTKFLQDEIEQAKLEANPFYFDLEDDEEAFEDSTVVQLQELYDQLVSKEYPISDDSLTMAVRFYPAGSQANLNFIENAFDALQVEVEALEPARFNAEMEVTLGGRLLRQLIEVTAITNDVTSSFGAGVLTLLLLVSLYFLYKSYQARMGKHWSFSVFLSEVARMPVTVLILGLPLLMSLLWTFGVVYWTYGSLNIMTSTLGLVLFGLGIDFGIHFYARYTEERGEGRSVEDAIVQTFMTTGQAIAVVAITTAAAFYILMLADFQGFSQFGFTAGMGTMFALLTMLIMVPALLSLFERIRLLKLTSASRPATNDKNLNPVVIPQHERRVGVSSVVLWLCFAALGVSLFALKDVAFEYDFGVLSPRLEHYEEIKKKWRKVYNDQRTRTATYVLTGSPEEAHEVAETVRSYAKQDTLTPTIDAVEVLSDRFPMNEAAQNAKLAQIAHIRELLDDSFLKMENDEGLDRLRQAASTISHIAIDQLPDYVKRPFTTKSGGLGQLVIIYPNATLSDGRHSMAFAEDVGTITTPSGSRYHTASTSIVAADMLRLMIDETPLIIALTLLLIVAFKMVILRKARWVLLALLPLASSFLWMFGLMTVFGLKLTFYNLVVLPTVLGIGDDSGIHLVHRYLEEGPGSVRRVLRSTGEHVLMSAVTTMIGFAGLMFSMHPGIRSIGNMAVLGIGMTLVAALVFLPALLLWMEKRKKPASEISAG